MTDIHAACALHQGGRLQEAEQAYRAILVAQPDHPDALHLLGVLALQTGRPDEGVRLIRRAIAINPAPAAPYANLGQGLQAAGRNGEAVDALAEAVRRDPANAGFQQGLGLALVREGDFEGAADSFRQASALAPDNPSFANDLANVLMTLGRLDEAEALYRQAVEADETFGPAWLGLIDTRKGPIEESAFEVLLGASAKTDLPPRHRAPLLFALARVQAEQGQDDAAFETLITANRVAKKAQPPDRQNHLLIAKSMITDFGAERLVRRIAPAEAGRGLVFIVGMPRSGTSLADLVLAAHPEVASVGESDIVLQSVNALERARRKTVAALCRDAPDSVAELGETIERAMRKSAPGTAFVVDKTPLNHLFVGHLHLALPGARIVHMRRDLRDTCLSCFEQYFTAGQAWSFDLHGIARYAKAYALLMAHWRETIPGAFRDVDYEELVGEPETAVRDLLAYCGLSWQDRCLAPHESQGKVHTASAAQVREPFHTRSIGRWRKHEERLAPLIRQLAPFLDANS